MIQRKPEEDEAVRPARLSDFAGQAQAKRSLDVTIRAANERGEQLDPVLLTGPPGVGKTTLARIIAHETRCPLKSTSGPVLRRPGHIAHLLTNMKPKSIVFVDEIHRMSREAAETLYGAMEDGKLDIAVGQGSKMRVVRVSLPEFTLVGATTRPGLLPAPLRDRFGLTLRLDLYDTDDLRAIIARTARLLNVRIDEGAIAEIAARSRGTPRVANHLLRRVRDHASVLHKQTIDAATVDEALKVLGIDRLGLDPSDRKVLKIVVNEFSGGPAGLETLAALANEDLGTIEGVIEPYLMASGLLVRTPKGRMATPKAIEFIKNDGNGHKPAPVVVSEPPVKEVVPESLLKEPGPFKPTEKELKALIIQGINKIDISGYVSAEEVRARLSTYNPARLTTKPQYEMAIRETVTRMAH